MPQTPPPKPEDYIVVDGSDGPRRDFRISVGLREGWDAEGGSLTSPKRCAPRGPG